MRGCCMLVVCLILTACVSPQVAHQEMTSGMHLPEGDTAITMRESLPELPEEVESEPLPVNHIPTRAATPTLLINLLVHQAPIQEVLFSIARESGLNMDIHPGLQGKVTLNVVQQSLPAILHRMAKQVDMHYEWVGGVWVISPDIPVIRTYRLNYVNMTRDTTGFIGAASEISSTGRAAMGNVSVTGAAAQPAMSAAGSSNSSRTAVASQSRYHLWESVVQNIQALLEETDKSAMVQRYGVTPEADGNIVLTESRPAASPQDKAVATGQDEAREVALAMSSSHAPGRDRDQQRQEYARWLGSRLIANPETGVLAIRATHRQHQQVKAYLQSVMQIAARQVLIEATIVEVELAHGFQMGIDWSRLASSAQQRGFVFAQSLGSQAAELNPLTGQLEGNNSKNALGQNNGNVALVLSYLNPFSRFGNLSASVTLLEQFGKTRVLSSPKLMVLNNQTAILKVVDNLVYFTIQSQISQSNSTAGGNLQAVTTTANTVPVGLVMAVTAQVNSQKRVNLNVRPTVSRVLRYVDDPNPQLGSGPARIASSIPEIQVREMESVLNVHSGHVAILGGLMQEEQRHLNDQVPGLAKIPLLGHAFKGKNEASRKTELVVFLRPTVIAQADVRQGELQSFSRLLPEHLPAPDTEAYEFAEPVDGSLP